MEIEYYPVMPILLGHIERLKSNISRDEESLEFIERDAKRIKTRIADTGSDLAALQAFADSLEIL